MPAENYTVSLGQYPLDQRGGVRFGKVGIGRHRQRTPGARAAAADLFRQSGGCTVLPLVARGNLLEGRSHDPPVDAMAGKTRPALGEIEFISLSPGIGRHARLLRQVPMASLGVVGNL